MAGERRGRRWKGLILDQSVYVIGPARRGPVKIGIAADVPGRLKTLQTGNPATLQLFAARQCPNAPEVERAMHCTFFDKWIKGEWFSVTADRAVRTLASLLDIGMGEWSSERSNLATGPGGVVYRLCMHCRGWRPANLYTANPDAGVCDACVGARRRRPVPPLPTVAQLSLFAAAPEVSKEHPAGPWRAANHP